MSVELVAGANCFFIICGGLRHLLHKKTLTIAMWRFMLAERAGNVFLVQLEQKRLEGNSIHLQHNRCNSNCP